MAGNSEDYMGDSDDLNLYDDLLLEEDEQLRKDLEKKEQQLEDLEKVTTDQKALILQLQTEMVSVKRENGILRRNISCLYKTAKAEIERKDDLMRELQRRYDGIVFRRTKDARTFLGNNGRNAAMSDDAPVATPPSVSYVSKKIPVSSETSDRPKKNRLKSEDVQSVRRATALSVLPNSRETEPPCKVVRELCDDEERMLGYASSALPILISKKNRSERRSRDISISNRPTTVRNSLDALQKESSGDVRSKDPSDTQNYPKSPNVTNDLSTTTSNRLEKTLDGKMVTTKSINDFSSENSMSDGASRSRTLVSKSLDRRRSNQPEINLLDKGNRRAQRTNDSSKSLTKEERINTLTRSLETGQPVRSESRSGVHQNARARESLEIHSAARSKCASGNHKGPLRESRTPMLTSSDDGQQSQNLKTKSTSHCEAEKLKINGECLNIARTSLVTRTKSAPNLKDEMHVERRQRKSSCRPATTNSADTKSIRSNYQRPTLIGGRSNDRRRDSRVVEERRNRVSKVRSPLKHGSRSSSTSHCRQTSLSVDRRASTIKALAEDARRADGRKTQQREVLSQRANGESRDGNGLWKQELNSGCSKKIDVSSDVPVKNREILQRKNSVTGHDLEDGEIMSDADT